VLAICDFDMYFTYVAASQPSSYHGTIVLYHAFKVDEKGFLHPPQGTIPGRYNKYAMSPHALDDSTSKSSWLTMETFRDRKATSLSLVWN
jgi:hypothetical protein